MPINGHGKTSGNRSDARSRAHHSAGTRSGESHESLRTLQEQGEAVRAVRGSVPAATGREAESATGDAAESRLTIWDKSDDTTSQGSARLSC